MPRILKYNEAKQKIMQFIKVAALDIGDRLPTERELAGQLGMSICPIRRAMDELQECGIVRRVAGAGTFFEGNLNLDTCESVCGLINIGDKCYPGGAELYRLKNYLEKHNAGHALFYVSRKPEPAVLDELAGCDRLIVTGFVNQGWVDLLGSLGKPMVQLGTAAYDAGLSKVIFDRASAIRLVLETFGRESRLGALLPVDSETCYSEQLRRTIATGMGANYDEHLVCSLSFDEDRISRMARYFEQNLARLDVLLVETAHLSSLLLLLACRPRTIDIPIVILEEGDLMPIGFEAMPNLYHIFYPESAIECAARILYEYPYSFLEQRRDYLLRPCLEGNGIRRCVENVEPLQMRQK